jgi:hypothetical protein
VNFHGLDAPVAFDNCDQLLRLLPRIARRWPYRACRASAGKNPFLRIAPSGRGYLLRSPFTSRPLIYPDPVNTMCAMLVELAWALLRSQPHLLCLHSAAVELDDRLVVLASSRRSGKSTLTACLAAAGHRVFTDDFLPLEVDESGWAQGLACGVSPRLRVPLPADINANHGAWIALYAGPTNQQYCYLELPDASQAPHGARRPIGAIVLLDRQEGARARLETISKTEALRSVIVQNFARAGRSNSILTTLDALIAGSGLYKLTYGNAADAVGTMVAAMTAEFAARPAPGTGVPLASSSQAPLRALFSAAQDYDDDAAYVQIDGVTEVALEGGAFLADPNGVAVHQLNAMSVGIWRMLSKPVRQSEIAEVLTAAFPDQAPAQIGRDVHQLLRHLASAHLIARPVVSETAESAKSRAAGMIGATFHADTSISQTWMSRS